MNGLPCPNVRSIGGERRVIRRSELEHLTGEERVDAVFDALGRVVSAAARAIEDVDPMRASRLAEIAESWVSDGPTLRPLPSPLRSGPHGPEPRQMPLLRRVK